MICTMLANILGEAPFSASLQQSRSRPVWRSRTSSGPERRRLAGHVKRLAVHGKGRPDGLQRRAVQNVVPRVHMRAEVA